MANYLPDDVTDQVDQLMNVTYAENERWDELVTEVVKLLESNAKLVEVMQAIYEQIQLSWPTEGDHSAQIAQAVENLMALSALHLIEAPVLLTNAMKKLDMARVRGKAHLLKCFQQADALSTQPDKRAAPDHAEQNPDYTCACGLKQAVSSFAVQFCFKAPHPGHSAAFLFIMCPQ